MKKVIVVIIVLLALVGIAYWVLEESDFDIDLADLGLEQEEYEEIEIEKTEENEVFSGYIDELNIIAEESEKYWDNLASNLEDPQQTDEWGKETLDYISEIEKSLEYIEEIDTPEEAEDIHEHYTEGIEKLEKALEKLRHGIENADNASIEEGGDLMEEGNEIREEAIDMIEEEI